MLESGPTDAALAERVQGLLAELDADEKDRQLLMALDAIHLIQYDIESFESVLARFREAFQEFGMPAGQGDATDAAQRFTHRPLVVREAVLGALDEWISQAESHPDYEPNLVWLQAVVAVAEPEGWRKKVRDAAAEKDPQKRRDSTAKAGRNRRCATLAGAAPDDVGDAAARCSSRRERGGLVAAGEGLACGGFLDQRAFGARASQTAFGGSGALSDCRGSATVQRFRSPYEPRHRVGRSR